MTSISRRDDCRLCESRSLELVLQLTPTPPGDMYLPPEHARKARECFPIDLYLCRDCGYVHLRDIVEPDSIYRDYIYTTASSPGLVAHFDRYAQHVVNRLQPSRNSLIVDIGSNDGALLRSFKGFGSRVAGIEPATKIAAHATAEGIPTICGYFDAEASRAVRAEHGFADVITANNVFANIDNLSSVVDNVKTLLAPNGVFIIEFAYLGDLIRNRIFDYIYHEHLSYFSIGTLQRFFERMGMTVIGAEHVGTKGGSVRIYVQRKDDIHPFRESLAQWVEDENRIGLRDPRTYHGLHDAVEVERRQCRETLASCKAKNQRIVGYGASITCTTLIYHFGLVEFLDFLVDDNDRKFGTLCPGTDLEVRPSSDLYQENAGVAVVLAWRFADMIVKRHKSFLDAGGIFIIPMPETKIVSGEGRR